jgi:hypothetical protein
MRFLTKTIRQGAGEHLTNRKPQLLKVGRRTTCILQLFQRNPKRRAVLFSRRDVPNEKYPSVYLFSNPRKPEFKSPDA